MKYLISGASSSLAKEIARELTARGHEITLVGRKSLPTFDFLSLEESLPTLFENHDVFLHLAHSFEMQTSPDLNQEASRQITHFLSQPNSVIKRCIFISSESASAIAKSEYGRSKYRTEQVFLKSKQSTVLRVGIIDDANVHSPYIKLKSVVKRTGILAFPNLRRKIFTVTTVRDISENIEKIVAMDLVGGPFCNKSSQFKRSILEVLEGDNIKIKLSLNIPIKVIEPLILGGKRLFFTKRISDSLSSILTEAEICQEIPERDSEK